MEIKDIWLAIRVFTIFTIFGIGIYTFLIGYIVGGISSFIFGDTIAGYIALISWLAGLFLAKDFIINVWKSYSKGIIIDIANDTFSIPARDVENSIEDIIKLKPFFDLAKRNSYKISEITALNNDTVRRGSGNRKGFEKLGYDLMTFKYFLNVSGRFGSQKLVFNSKQKRDECRAALSDAKRQIGSSFSGSSDINLDI